MRYLATHTIEQAMRLAQFVGPRIAYELGPIGEEVSITFLSDAFAYRFLVGLTRELGSLDNALDFVCGAMREESPSGVTLHFPEWELT